MLFKDNFYLELWQPICSGDWNHLCKFGRRYHEERFCETILNLDQWFRRRCRLKVFLIWSSGSPFVRRSVTICAILEEGIQRNNSVKLFWPVVQEEMSFEDISYLELWQPLCSVDWNHLCIIGRRHHEEQPCEIILNLDQWFRRKCLFLIWSYGSPFVQRSVTNCAILAEGIKRNNSVKLFWTWVSCYGDVF